jgi:hypothetical protein
MWQVWQTNKLICLNLCHTIETQGYFLLQLFIAIKNKNTRSPNDDAGELKSR